MKQKKEYIRISEYARLTGGTASGVNAMIERQELECKLIGGIKHVPYPSEDLIKYKRLVD